ncbi:MAG: hypothetical protein R3F35_08640 [Myxococcota bacterium]
MKRRAILVNVVLALMATPVVASAQQPGSADQAEMMRRLQDPAAMQRMAAEAQAAQTCMKEIDRAKLDALEQRGRTASQEIERLCEAGKRDEALARALAVAREMRADPTVQKLRECTKGMAEMARNLPIARIPGVRDEPEPTERDICSSAGR